MKRLVFCFDGTWNKLDAPNPTNVVITAQSVTPATDDGVAQIIHYDPGVGTGADDKWTGGLFGGGLLDKIVDAYTFLVFNYSLGDEIYVFGFSRGAFTARAFVGFLRNCGILQRKNAARIPEAVHLYQRREKDQDHNSSPLLEFRAELSAELCVDTDEDAWRCLNVAGYASGASPVLRITYLGVWDTVGSLGVPDDLAFAAFANANKQFYEVDLSPMVVSARHALSIDEQRKSFNATQWPNFEALNNRLGFTGAAANAPYQQKWFPGDHGSVGGGGDIRGLSDAALDWVLTGARHMGLKVDVDPSSPLFHLQPDDLAPLQNMKPAPQGALSLIMSHLPKSHRRPGPDRVEDVAPSAVRRWRASADSLPEKVAYRPQPLEGVATALDAGGGELTPQADHALPTGAVQPAGAPGGHHTVVYGDTLTGIALKVYGNAGWSDELFKANRKILSDPDRIYIGQVLVLPPAPAPASAEASSP